MLQAHLRWEGGRGRHRLVEFSHYHYNNHLAAARRCRCRCRWRRLLIAISETQQQQVAQHNNNNIISSDYHHHHHDHQRRLRLRHPVQNMPHSSSSFCSSTPPPRPLTHARHPTRAEPSQAKPGVVIDRVLQIVNHLSMCVCVRNAPSQRGICNFALSEL